jgi:serine/threonine protein kinase
MLYEMLAGTLPFVGRTDDLIVRAILEQPVPDLRKVRPEVPDEVQGLIERMLHKSPSHRISAAQEVYETLRVVLGKLRNNT